MNANDHILAATIATMATNYSLPLPKCLGKSECELAVAAFCRAAQASGATSLSDAVQSLAEMRDHSAAPGTRLASLGLVRIWVQSAVMSGWVRQVDMNRCELTPACIRALAEFPPVQAQLEGRP